tara:strand:+ start:196 stop:2748 length:2553 start_codon:yes stop_codon:yes gene_type:complete
MKKTCSTEKVFVFSGNVTETPPILTKDNNNFKSKRTKVLFNCPDLADVELSESEETETGITAKPFCNSIVMAGHPENDYGVPTHVEPKTKFIEHVNMDVVRYLKSLKKQELIKIVWGSIKDDRVTQNGHVLTKDEYVKYFNQVLDVYYKTDGQLIRDYKFAKDLDFGRLYVKKGGIQMCQKLLKGALVPDNVSDIDIKNCHVSILRYFAKTEDCCKKIETPYLDEYVQNRESFLETAVTSKVQVLILMNCDVPRYTGNKATQELRGLVKEFQKIKKELYKKYSETIKTDNTKNPVSSTINKLICKLENEILQRAVYFSEQEGHVVEALMFDGFHVVLKEETDMDEFILTLNYISLQYGIEWCHKPFDRKIRDEIPEDFDQEEPVNEIPEEYRYKTIKEKFETNHFMMEDPVVFAKENPKKVVFYNYNKFFTLTAPITYQVLGPDGNAKTMPFLSRWIADSTRRCYLNMEFYPPPLVCPENEYNLFKGFDYEKWKPEECEYDESTDISIFLNHLRLLSGDSKKEEIYNYLLNWFAHMIQKPGELPEVAIVIKSEQGVGKNIIFDSFGKIILGHSFYLTTADPSHILGRFADLKGKILITADEAGGKNIYENNAQLKALITNHTVKCETKGIQAMDITNYARIVSLTNQNVPVVVEQSDRRYVAIEILEKPKEEEYYTAFGEAFKDKRRMKKFIDYLLSIDLSKFSFRKRPFTNYYYELQNITIPKIDKFLDTFLTDIKPEKDGEYHIQARQFCQNYENWLVAKTNCKPNLNASIIGKELKKYENFGLTKKKLKYGQVYIFDKKRMFSRMLEKRVIVRDFGDSETTKDKLEILMGEQIENYIEPEDEIFKTI